MAVTPPRTLSIWAVSDGRAGIENQALGLAEAVARATPAEITLKRIGYRAGIGRLPQRLNLFPRAALDPAADPIAPPWPDVWIAAGRATLALSARVRRWSGGRTFVVQLQDPRWPARLFDLVVPPEHDGLTGPDVFPILGSPNRVTPERLAEAAALFGDRIGALPAPRAAVLVGGRSKAFDLPAAHAADLAGRIAAAAGRAGGSLMVTVSRRTPPEARAAMERALQGPRAWIWDGDGPNPYFAFLAAADVVLVTEDSTNMAVEAATAGRPVLRLPMAGPGDGKFRRLHAALDARGLSRPFADALEAWPVTPLAETDRAAAEVIRRLAPDGIRAR